MEWESVLFSPLSAPHVESNQIVQTQLRIETYPGPMKHHFFLFLQGEQGPSGRPGPPGRDVSVELCPGSVPDRAQEQRQELAAPVSQMVYSCVDGIPGC